MKIQDKIMQISNLPLILLCIFNSAWEAALVVKVFNIDDSSFKNHPIYPADMVHYSDGKNYG